MLKHSKFFNSNSKPKTNVIMLTLAIENKLYNMSNDLLIKTVTDYKKYKYDISIKNKAEEILNKRGVYIEENIVEEVKPPLKLKIISFTLRVFLIVGAIIFYVNIPRKTMYYISFYLFPTYYILSYYINKNKY